MKTKIKELNTFLDKVYYEGTREQVELYYDDEYACCLENPPAKDDAETWEQVYTDIIKKAQKRYAKYEDKKTFNEKEAVICVMQHAVFYGAETGVEVDCFVSDLDPCYGGPRDEYFENIYNKFIDDNKAKESMPEWFRA